MIVTTTPTIEGHPIREYKGLVTGETIIGANFVKDFLPISAISWAEEAARMRACYARLRT